MELNKIIEKLEIVDRETMEENKAVVKFNKKIEKCIKDRQDLHHTSKGLEEEFFKKTKKIRDKHNEALLEELKKTKAYKVQEKAVKLLQDKEAKLIERENKLSIEKAGLVSAYRKSQEAVFFNQFGVEVKENAGLIYPTILRASVVKKEQNALTKSLDQLGVKYE